jgi:hypothetical protein
METWPNSFEVAHKCFSFWGLKFEGEKYFIGQSEALKGWAISVTGVVYSPDKLRSLWDKSQISIEYSFHKFQSEKDLYCWMASI